MLRKLIASTFLTAAIAYPAAAVGLNADGAVATDTQVQTEDMSTGTSSSGDMKLDTQDDSAAAEAGDELNTEATADASATFSIDGQEIAATDLIGTVVVDAAGEEIGDIGDVVVSGKNEVEYFVIDVGGFLGIGEKPVAVDPDELTITADASGAMKVTTQMTRADFEASSEFDASVYPMDDGSRIME